MASTASPTDGVQRIAAAFSGAGSEGRAAVIPYVTLGYPTVDRSVALAEAAVAGGADILELGVPFSDPLADGRVIQRATQVALQQGLTVGKCLELAARLRSRQIVVPLIFMGYYNPILAYGEGRFCRACRDAGVDGLIVPDLPPEEAESLERYCEENGLALIYLLAPTSTSERTQLVTQRARGFVYLVSVTGTTGTRNELPAGLGAFVSRVRAVTDKPVAVGFGISSPDQAREVAAKADGVIVGSAVVRLAEKPDGAQRIREFVSMLRSAAERRSGESAGTRT
jgi:tryptophan synthase alpha chain